MARVDLPCLEIATPVRGNGRASEKFVLRYVRPDGIARSAEVEIFGGNAHNTINTLVALRDAAAGAINDCERKVVKRG